MFKKILFIIFFCFSISYNEYNRYDFSGGTWKDFDKDCQDTRVEVLIEESIIEPKMSLDGCNVDSGLWYCVYSDSFYTNPRDLDIDHVVPLKEVYGSGGKEWNREKKIFYSNYLLNKSHLIAVNRSENRSKGSKSPDKWMPKNKKFHKEYCKIWFHIKEKWNLHYTKEEFNFIDSVLNVSR